MFRNITSLIFLLLWGLQAKASYPTYVGDKKLSVSTQSFNRYIKPQLKNLYNEYFYLVDTLAGKRSRSVELYHSIKKLEKSRIIKMGRIRFIYICFTDNDHFEFIKSC